MKAVILAAGKGTRLGGSTAPKPLTLLSNGKSILQLQVENLLRYLSIDDIIIVVGYRKELVMDLFPEALYVYNPDYAKENTSKSLLKALRKCDDAILWLNGDVVFHYSVLENIMASKTSGMLVNRAAVGEEEVKYRTDGRGRIVEVSKEVVEPEGEALGINIFQSGDLPVLIEGLGQCEPMDYFEKAVEYAIEKGVAVDGFVVAGDRCVEVDFPEDVEKANSLIASWSLK